uniref:Uncharacterized protein n=1 Tax=Rhizophora mucronata TaxID=61149 RepID=A0A2P2NV57_RHIMU
MWLFNTCLMPSVYHNNHYKTLLHLFLDFI